MLCGVNPWDCMMFHSSPAGGAIVNAIDHIEHLHSHLETKRHEQKVLKCDPVYKGSVYHTISTLFD